MSESPQQPLSKVGQRLWSIFAFSIFVVTTIAVVSWILQHPFGTNWDETNYINQIVQDRTALGDGPVSLVKALLRRDASRPPAYRILALPITAIWGGEPTALRLFAWLAFGISVYLIYQTGEQLRDRATGGFAACFLLTCPILIGPNMRFYVDYSLYLAIAGSLYFLFRHWHQTDTKSRNWIGLGLSLGLGAMAKPTIAFILGPMLLVLMGLRLMAKKVGPSLQSLFKSYGVAMAIMLPWWVLNGDDAIAKAFQSGGNTRDALGTQGELGTLLKWGYVFIQSVTGPMLSLLTGAIVLSFLWVWIVQRRLELTRPQRYAVLLCLAGAIPFAGLAASGVNHNPRLIAPLLMPLSLAIGLLASSTGWFSRRPMTLVAVVLMTAQVTVMLAPQPGSARYQEGDQYSKTHNWGNPTSVMRREEQWNWSLLYDAVRQYPLDTPRIGYLGNAKMLNPPQIRSPWLRLGKTARVDPLWKDKSNPIDWEDIMRGASRQDILVVIDSETTGDALVDYRTIDNQHNPELVERLRAAEDFVLLTTLKMGRFTPTDVAVFVRNDVANPKL
ncbi:MAG: glycosyltransferase family 39 protein [Cyanobacteria bacterium J06648_16]